MPPLQAKPNTRLVTLSFVWSPSRLSPLFRVPSTELRAQRSVSLTSHLTRLRPSEEMGFTRASSVCGGLPGAKELWGASEIVL